MKSLWKKVMQGLAWFGATLLALAGAAFLLRRKRPNQDERLSEVFEKEKELAEAQQEAEELGHALRVEKAKAAAKARANRLERNPSALADALTRLSDDGD